SSRACAVQPPIPDAGRPRYRRQSGVRVLAAEPIDAGRCQRDQPAILGTRLDVAKPLCHANPPGAGEKASVGFPAYPLSLVPRPSESFLKSMADEEMWKAFAEIGIEAIHTGPVKRAGGITGWELTPSVDGHFDRISTQIDPAFGTEEEFRSMCGTANWYAGAVHHEHTPAPTP